MDKFKLKRPDGTDYPEGRMVKLKDILDYEQPNKYIVESENYDDSYKIPVLTAGQSLILGYTNEINGVYEASNINPVIIFDDFMATYHWIDFSFKVKSSAMKFLKVKDNLNNFRYIYLAMKSIDYKPKEHSRQWISNFSNFEIYLPSLEEQNAIVELLEPIDKQLEDERKTIENLKEFKKGMLQKMFPEKGKNVPEIRFPEFTDDWEQRKLLDVAEFSKGSGYSKSDLCDVGTPIILYGRLYTKYETNIKNVDTFAVPKTGSIYSKGGEVIVPASGETSEDIARAATVENAGILLGGDLNIVMPSKDINSAFLALSISNGEPQRELAKKAQGKSVVHIHNEEIKGLEIAFPKREEQDRISAYFANLDHLITLHQRKLEKLELLKKGLMQTLFA